MSETPPKPRWRRWLREIAVTSVFALVILSAKSSVADHYVVPSGSMLPTVEIGDRILVNKASYGLRVPFTHHAIAEAAGPARGDVVVLDDPEDDKTLLKRVIAVPGDRVAVHAGHVAINGTPVPVEHRADGDHELLGDADHLVDFSHGGGRDLGQLRFEGGQAYQGPSERGGQGRGSCQQGGSRAGEGHEPW